MRSAAEPAKPTIHLDNDGATIDARILAEGLDVDEALVPELLRSGRLTTRFEKGEGEHAGQSRLTFLIPGLRLRFVIDSEGRILKRFRTRFQPSPRR